jgi:hypothetical protein
MTYRLHGHYFNHYTKQYIVKASETRGTSVVVWGSLARNKVVKYILMLVT